MGLDIVWHLASSHFILVVLVVFFSAHVTHNIYGLVLVTDLQNDYVNSHDFVARLNTKLQIEMYGHFCLLYTSPSPRDRQKSRMPSSA